MSIIWLFFFNVYALAIVSKMQRTTQRALNAVQLLHQATFYTKKCFIDNERIKNLKTFIIAMGRV